MTEKTYFRRQRFIGIVLLVLTAIPISIFGGDVTYAFFTVPMGLWLILSKQPIIYGYENVIDKDEES